MGTSGGIWGLERGYCMMIGGPDEAVRRIEPILKTLAPGLGDIPQNSRPGDTRRHGRGRIPPLRAFGRGALRQDGPQRHRVRPDAGLCRGFRHPPQGQLDELPEDQRYDLNLADIAEVWRRGSVVGSWLLDLIAMALAEDPKLARVHGLRPGLGRGALDDHGGSRGGGRRPTCSPPPSSPASGRGRNTRSARRSSRPCGTSSAATSSGPRGVDRARGSRAGRGLGACITLEKAMREFSTQNPLAVGAAVGRPRSRARW